MPVEIRELIIRATVRDTADQNDKQNRPSDAAIDVSREEKIVAKCVEQVMDILRIQKER